MWYCRASLHGYKTLHSFPTKDEMHVDLVTTDVVAALVILEREQEHRLQRLRDLPHSATKSVLG